MESDIITYRICFFVSSGVLKGWASCTGFDKTFLEADFVGVV